jgi:cell wall-associated NlpC family hydrolase
VLAAALAVGAVSAWTPVGPGSGGAPFRPVAAVGALPPDATDIPDVVLTAYLRAEAELAEAAPSCGVRWWMLAAIGKIESGHARGGLVDASGTTVSPILGPALDGSGGTAAIGDGATWARARGPMQFLPATWRAYGRGDPDNVGDSAAAAARYLCAGRGDLSDPADLAAALHRYNPSATYVASVLAWSRVYAGGAPDHDGALLAGAAAVAFATAQLGLPYIWGGDGPDDGDAGFDCSGLTHAAYAAAGIRIPRTAQTQYDHGPRLPLEMPLQVGDLLFYGAPGRVHHVGIYVGEDRMINAPTFGEPVRTAGYRWPGDDYLGASRPAARPGTLPFVAPHSYAGPGVRASGRTGSSPAGARAARGTITPPADSARSSARPVPAAVPGADAAPPAEPTPAPTAAPAAPVVPPPARMPAPVPTTVSVPTPATVPVPVPPVPPVTQIPPVPPTVPVPQVPPVTQIPPVPPTVPVPQVPPVPTPPVSPTVPVPPRTTAGTVDPLPGGRPAPGRRPGRVKVVLPAAVEPLPADASTAPPAAVATVDPPGPDRPSPLARATGNSG